jgi:F-type H+-transporting ATPase subunit b
MHIDWSTLGLQTVNALVLIWLLAHFLFRPVADAIAGRQKAAVQLLDEAKAAKAAAQSERDKAAVEAARLADHRAEAFKALEAEAAAAKSTLLAKAQAEADKLLAAGKAEIENKRVAEALATDDRERGLLSTLQTSFLIGCLETLGSPASWMGSRPAWRNCLRKRGRPSAQKVSRSN